MPSTELLKRRIRTAGDLRSLVRTMKALAAVSIRQYERAVESLVEYNRTVEMGFQILLREREPSLLRGKQKKRCLGGVVFGSDLGMCGQFNEQIATHAIESMKEIGCDPADTSCIVVGARAIGYLEDAGQKADKELSVPSSINAITLTVQEIVAILWDWWMNQKIDRLYLFYNRHVSGSQYRPHTVRLLPLDLEWLRDIKMRKWPTRVLPTFSMEWNRLFPLVVRQYVFVSLFRAVAESQASENASRLAAMQGAEKNIDDVLSELRLQFHQERQMAITDELLDIVSGFEALAETES
jgi:F-type H+-transporting ATPase subunit gamma